MSSNESPSGKRIFLITTRPREKFQELPRGELALEIVNCPLTSMEEIKPDQETVSKIREFNPDVVVLTSEYGADIFFKQFLGSIDTGNVRFLAIGNSTARKIEEHGFKPEVPEAMDSMGIAGLIGRTVSEEKHIALFRSDSPNRSLDTFLESRDYNFIDIALYRISEVESPAMIEYIMDEKCYGVLLTSSKEARIFSKLVEKAGIRENLLKKVKLFPIGNTTSRTMEEIGLTPSEPRGKSDFEGLLKNISKKYADSK